MVAYCDLVGLDGLKPCFQMQHPRLADPLRGFCNSHYRGTNKYSPISTNLRPKQGLAPRVRPNWGAAGACSSDSPSAYAVQ